MDCLGTPGTAGMGLYVDAAQRRVDIVDSAFHLWLCMIVVSLRESISQQLSLIPVGTKNTLHTPCDEVNRLLSIFFKTLRLTTDQEKELNTLISEMGKIYGSAKVCQKNDSANCVNFNPDANRIMSSSTDYEEITYYWEVSHKCMSSTFNDQQLDQLIGDKWVIGVFIEIIIQHNYFSINFFCLKYFRSK